MGDRTLRDNASGSSPRNTPSQGLTLEDPCWRRISDRTQPLPIQQTPVENIPLNSTQATAIPSHPGDPSLGHANSGAIASGEQDDYDGFSGACRYYRDIFAAFPENFKEFIEELPEDVADYIIDFPENLKEFILDDLFSGELNHKDFADKENGERRKKALPEEAASSQNIVTDAKEARVSTLSSTEPEPTPSSEAPSAPEFGKSQAGSDTGCGPELQEYCITCKKLGRLEKIRKHYKVCRWCGSDPRADEGPAKNFTKRKHVCCDCGKTLRSPGVKFCHKCGAAQDPDEDDKMQEKYKQWKLKKDENDARKPWFILIWPAIVFCMWLFGAWAASGKDKNKGIAFSQLEGGLDTINPGSTTLQVHEVCDDLRLGFIFYRCWLYQCTHLGFTHVMGNCLITWFLGIGLEKMHKSLTMCVFFLIGVIGGACFFFVSDAHRVVAGMSGGVYAILGMRIANLVLNWSEKRQPMLETLLISGWLGWDLLNYMHFVDKEANAATMSYSTHMGGMYVGFMIFFLFGHNAEPKKFEEHLRICAWPAIFVVPLFTVCWGIPWPPRTIFDTTPWCFKQLVYNRTLFVDRAWHCVSCGNAEDSTCIKDWLANSYIENVSYTNCQDRYGWGYQEYGEPQWNITTVA